VGIACAKYRGDQIAGKRGHAKIWGTNKIPDPILFILRNSWNNGILEGLNNGEISF
jgi:hypothetical protein